MSYPQGYLYQPSASLALYSCPAYSTSVISGPRTDELGRSPAGSAFSPYAGSTAFSAPSPGGYNSHLQYGADPAAAAAAAAAAFSSYVASPYDHSPAGMAGSLGYHHPYAAGPLGSYPYGDPAYRKNATRDATATLKAWLNEHRKNPYPTKGEKIMLAIITKMTLTQVSTWFANARRRLKKENKMTWTPRNRSEDEDEEENIDLEKHDGDGDDAEPPKPDGKAAEAEAGGGVGCEAKGAAASSKELDGALSDSDCREGPEEAQAKGAVGVGASPPGGHCGLGPRLLLQTPPHPREDPVPALPAHYRPPSAELRPILVPPTSTSVIHSPQAPAQGLAKPKLWSLAEIATSADKAKEGGGGGEAPPSQQLAPSGSSAPAPPAPSSCSPCAFPNGAAAAAVLSRAPVYYSSPFYPGYTNYGSFGALHSPAASTGPGSPPFNGLSQTLLSRAEALAKETKLLRSQAPPLELGKDSPPYELKKGLTVWLWVLNTIMGW